MSPQGAGVSGGAKPHSLRRANITPLNPPPQLHVPQTEQGTGAQIPAPGEVRGELFGSWSSAVNKKKPSLQPLGPGRRLTKQIPEQS